MIKQLAVASNTLCAHPVMRRILLEAYPAAKLWDGDRIEDEDQLIEFLQGSDAAIIGFEPITDRVLGALPDLEIIAKFGAGCEKIDFDAMQKHGKRFGYTFGVTRLSVAELPLSFMVSALRWVTPLNQA
ncbi:MAG: phosphoglycerate dehydrogenase, partial [Rhodospirillaceae bacterium]|nr:phosphoglycerate dehydrogenase [Rhodospirillaceae bacterium]